MARRRFSIFSLAFLDVMFCGFGAVVLISSLAVLPLALAFARTSCWDLREKGWRQLYGLGLWQLPLVSYLKTKPWRKTGEHPAAR